MQQNFTLRDPMVFYLRLLLVLSSIPNNFQSWLMAS